MALDGIFTGALISELKEILLDSRIDKIHQPEKDELIIHTRGKNGSHKLILSADASLPYMSLTESKKENPLTPPMFCMLLRKHLSGGKLLNIEQRGTERVVIFTIESRDELGALSEKLLIFEIMGKHSNITLVKKDTMEILDAIKRIPPALSRVRSILPGLTFDYLESTKLNPREFSEEEFLSTVKDSEKSTPVFKTLYQKLEGFSPSLSKEILNSIHLDIDRAEKTITLSEWQSIYGAIVAFFESKDINPLLYIRREDSKMVDFYHKSFSFYNSDDYIVEEELSLIDLINRYYGSKNKVNRIHQRTQELKKHLSQRIDRLKSKIAKLENELIQAEDADLYKVKGELITANIYAIEKGMNKVTVLNYYMDPAEDIEIQLDIRLTPSENAQKYFKRYNKLKTAQTELVTQIDQAKHEADYLENVLLSLEISENPSDINQIRDELVQSGYIKKKYSKKNKKEKKSLPESFHSSDGFQILVGKNNLQNDQLTLKTASNKDLWFHTKEIPGSHVVIRTEGKEASETAIYEAAMLAAYHSKARASSQVPVDYTLIKHVSKPSGAKPGMVIYVKQQTIYVTPEDDFINNLRSN